MRTRSLTIALVAAAIGAAPALAQQHNAPAAASPATPAPSASTTMTAPAATQMSTKALSGKLRKYNGEWRTSQLVGATVYGSNGDSLGTVADLLTGDNGQIQQVVISTGGGVLGIGGKQVEVPFSQLKLEPSSSDNNRAQQVAATSNEPVANGGPMARGAAGTSTTSQPSSRPMSASESSTQPMYYSLVLPNATQATLDQMQTFKFAS